MKQRVALLLVGILVGVLVMTLVPAQAHHGPSARRLRRQVAALRNRVSNLEFAVFDCEFAQGISEFGIPEEGEGYLYDDGVETFLASAANFDDGNDPHIFALAVDPACVTTSSRSTAARPFKQGEMGAQSPKAKRQ